MRIIDADEFKDKVVKYSHQSTKTIGQALSETSSINAVEIDGKFYIAEEPKIKSIHKEGEVVIGGFREYNPKEGM